MIDLKEKIWSPDGKLRPIEFVQGPDRDIAIILVNRNRRDLTDYLAEQILSFSNEDNLTFDLYVVDIGSEPEGRSPYTTIEYEDKDFRGKCYAHNIGVRQATLTANYRYIWVMMNDLRFDNQPDAMTRLIRIMDANPELGILSPTNVGTGSDYPGAAPQVGQEYRKVPVCDYLSLLMRGDLVREVGFLNPDFKYCFGAIHELSHKVYSTHKWALAYCDAVQYNHLGGTTYGKTKNVVSRDDYLANARRFAAYYFYNNYGSDWDQKFTSILPEDVTLRHLYSLHRGNWQRSLPLEEQLQLQNPNQAVKINQNQNGLTPEAQLELKRTPDNSILSRLKGIFCKSSPSNLTDSIYRHAYIEPVNSCPVKCIPCPVGRGSMEHPSAVVLDLGMARQCFHKLSRELSVKTVIMGNWGEPLLHPQFSSIIDLAKEAGIGYVGVSTSLSVNRDMREIAEAGLDSIHVSMSGITPETYNVSHLKGNFDLVISNLQSLTKHIAKLNKKTPVTLRWHRYRHNEYQFESAQTMCKQLGIQFLPYFGHLGSIESLNDWSNNCLEEPLKSFVENSVYGNFVTQACELNSGAHECRQSNQLVIDSDGSLIFCCSCYKKYKPNQPFLQLTHEEIMQFKQPNSSMCSRCLDKGWSGYMNRPKTLEEYSGRIKL